MSALPHISEQDAFSQFYDALAEHGLRTNAKLEPDGAIHRFYVEGDKRGTRNGWYVLHMDGFPAGAFGSWNKALTVTWHANTGGRQLSPEEQRQVQMRIEAARKEREAALRRQQGEVAKTASLMLKDLPECTDSHGYCTRKGVKAYPGVRVGRWQKVDEDTGEIWLDVPDAMLVPVQDIDDRTINVQAIFAAKHPKLGRDKDFMAGGRKRGGFFKIGGIRAGDPVAICEGYATAATVHEATGWCTVVAFDAGNLEPVAIALREKMPHQHFVIAADNDRWTTEPVENPGVTFAQQAAARIHARVVVPQFADLDTKPTDFNDLAALEGVDTVVRQLIPPAEVALPAPANDNHSVEPIRVESVDVITRFPDMAMKGNKPLATLANAEELLRRLGVTVRYNVISKRPEYLIPGARNSIDNRMRAASAFIASWARRIGMPADPLGEYLLTIADNNLYNPVANWILSKPWDRVSRLRAFFDTVTPVSDVTLPDGRSMRDVLIRKWMLSAVAGAFNPEGVSAHGVLTFAGPQGLGKTSWFKRLAPAHMGVLQDGMSLNPNDKDSQLLVLSKWLVELGELDATFRRSDLSSLKQWLGKDTDELRAPYAKEASTFARRTVFFASVNETHFLHDTTGNRRYWTINCQSIDYKHDLDMQQVWAEFHHLFQQGEEWHLSDEEKAALAEQNADHEAINPTHDMVDRAFQWELPQDRWVHMMRATEIVIAAGIERPTKAEVNLASAYVQQRYGVTTKRVGKNKDKMWAMPPKWTPYKHDDEGRPF